MKEVNYKKIAINLIRAHNKGNFLSTPEELIDCKFHAIASLNFLRDMTEDNQAYKDPYLRLKKEIISIKMIDLND